MRAILNIIKNILITVIVAGFLMAGIDYVRMNSGSTPIFNINSYNPKTKIQTYRGLFYVAERKVKASTDEPLVDSSNMKFKILTFDVSVQRKFNTENTFKVETKPISNCHESSKLYYANLDIKIYTYCLESIKIKDGNKTTDLNKYIEKNKDIVEDIDMKLDYTGLYKDNSTLMFQEKDDDFTNSGLTMYRCHKENINDVYFAPDDTAFMNDFCTFKDDDLKFIFKIEDESTKPQDKLTNDNKETFYSDENNDYKFDYIKSDKVYIVRPESRGRVEIKYPLKEVLDKKMLTIDDLESKGLQFEKVAKK